MLLKHLYDFARSRNILDDLAFALKPIRWIIPLDGRGQLVGVGLVETEGERNRGKEYVAPRTGLDKGVGGIAEFLADGLTAVFGLDPDRERPLAKKQRRDRDANNARKLAPQHPTRNRDGGSRRQGGQRNDWGPTNSLSKLTARLFYSMKQ